MTKQYDVAAYVWPSYSGDDPRTRIFWPEGMGEWETVRKAQPKNPQHERPRQPVWGYVNEADPYVMEMQINAAANHGVNVFIYDWYWYDRRPFLEHCLNNGFLQAANNHRMRFYLMWANHHAGHLWDVRNSHDPSAIIWEGTVDRPEFERLGRRLIEKYFTHPLYYRIDDKPVFMVYDLNNLLSGLGGITQAAQAMDWLRDEAVRAGLPGLHWQLVLPRIDPIHDADGRPMPRTQVVRDMGWDSLTHYQMMGLVDRSQPFEVMIDQAEQYWQDVQSSHDIPYFPQVAVGWDDSARFRDIRPHIVRSATPEQVESAFRAARRFADAHPHQPPLVTVNSWNEWTESSYLQPDDTYGYGYLQALQRVFVG